MTVSAVVLAAGASSRLGSPKALATLGNLTVLERLTAAVRALDLPRRTLVVTGAHHAEIEPLARFLDLDLVCNEAWADGRTGSIACAAAERSGDDLLLLPADVPLVTAGTLAALEETWRGAGEPSRGWLAPWLRAPGTAEARYGHPILMGSALAAETTSMDADAPLHELRARAEPLLGVEVDDPGVLDDLDTPQDLDRLRRREPH